MDRLEEAVLSGALTSPPSQEADPDGREPLRTQSDDDDGETLDGGYVPLNSAIAPSRPISSTMSRGRSGNTGPKGVLQDFKAAHGKSGAILGGGLLDHNTNQTIEHRLDRLILRPGTSPLSGKTLRQQATHSRRQQSSATTSDESEGEKEVKENRRRERIAEMQRQSGGRASPGVKTDSQGRRLFGYLREVGLENFIQAIDAEKDDRECAVVIHLYDQALHSCQMLNSHLATIARHHPTTKFLRGVASHLDFFTTTATSTTSSTTSVHTSTPSPSKISFSSSLHYSTKEEDEADYDRQHRHYDDIHYDDDDGDNDLTYMSEKRSGTLTSTFTDASMSTMIGQDPFADQINKIGGGLGGRRERRRATDHDVLPTIVIYRGGEQVESIIAVERELPDGEILAGEEGCRQVEQLLADHGLISKSSQVSNRINHYHRSRSQSFDSLP